MCSPKAYTPFLTHPPRATWTELLSFQHTGGATSQASIQTRVVRRVQPQSAPERNPSVEGTALTNQRELRSSDSAARDVEELDKETPPRPTVAISLGRLLLFG